MPGRIRDGILRPGDRISILIDAVQHKPRLHSRKNDGFLRTGQRKRLGLRQNAQLRRVAIRQAQHIRPAQRLQRNAAIL